MSKKSNKIFWAFLATFVVVMGAGALSRHLILRSSAASGTSVETGSKVSIVPATAQQPQIGRIEAELITIRPTGFEPALITRPARPFILAVSNRTGLESARLRLKLSQVTGAGTMLITPTLIEVTVSREQLDWSDLETLPPGSYALTE